MARERHFCAPNDNHSNVRVGKDIAHHGVDTLCAVEISNGVVLDVFEQRFHNLALGPQATHRHVMTRVFDLENVFIENGPVGKVDGVL